MVLFYEADTNIRNLLVNEILLKNKDGDIATIKAMEGSTSYSKNIAYGKLEDIQMDKDIEEYSIYKCVVSGYVTDGSAPYINFKAVTLLGFDTEYELPENFIQSPLEVVLN